jgi:hypothetical protein
MADCRLRTAHRVEDPRGTVGLFGRLWWHRTPAIGRFRLCGWSAPGERSRDRIRDRRLLRLGHRRFRHRRHGLWLRHQPLGLRRQLFHLGSGALGLGRFYRRATTRRRRQKDRPLGNRVETRKGTLHHPRTTRGSCPANPYRTDEHPPEPTEEALTSRRDPRALGTDRSGSGGCEAPVGTPASWAAGRRLAGPSAADEIPATTAQGGNQQGQSDDKTEYQRTRSAGHSLPPQRSSSLGPRGPGKGDKHLFQAMAGLTPWLASAGLGRSIRNNRYSRPVLPPAQLTTCCKLPDWRIMLTAVV